LAKLPDHDATPEVPRTPALGLGSRALRNTVVVLAAKVVARLIALVTVIFVPGMAKRIGQGLASAEGFDLGTPPVTAAIDTPESAA